MFSSSVKRTAQVALLTAAFAASGSAVAMAGTNITSGDNSILGGNQINAPISVPVNVCGNALAILGDAVGACQGGAAVLGGSDHNTNITSGDNSIGGGNQINAPVSVPVNICGNSAAVLGTALAGCKGGAVVGSRHHHPTPPPPCKHHHPTPPPCKHHHHHPTPPPGHHHHPGTGGGGMGTSSGSTPVSGGSLPTTGANFLSLLAMAGGATLAGASVLLFGAKRRVAGGVFAVARRAFSAAK